MLICTSVISKCFIINAPVLSYVIPFWCMGTTRVFLVSNLQLKLRTWLSSFNSEITTDKVVLVPFFLWRRLLGDFHVPSKKKKRLFLTSQGYSELWRCSGMGGGELVLSTEFVNLISHRRKDLRADPPAIFFLNTIEATIHWRSLPRFPLTNIFRLPTLVGNDRGLEHGRKGAKWVREAGGRREKEERQEK